MCVLSLFCLLFFLPPVVVRLLFCLCCVGVSVATVFVFSPPFVLLCVCVFVVVLKGCV